MIIHSYDCPICENAFTVKHPDELAYEDPCPHCGYSLPSLVELVEETEGDE